MSDSESSGTHEYARGWADARRANIAEIERLTKERDAALGNADMNYQKWVEAQAEIERLLDVLRQIADLNIPPGYLGHADLARKALANKQNATEK